MAKAPAKMKISKIPDKLTSASTIEYLAQKNRLVRKEVKQVLEDLFEIVGVGVMRGEIRSQASRPRSQVKPATKVPRITFSKTFKEAALKAKAKT